MKRTKIIALVVSVVMLMALLAGCGGSSAPASDGGSSGSSALVHVDIDEPGGDDLPRGVDHLVGPPGGGGDRPVPDPQLPGGVPAGGGIDDGSVLDQCGHGTCLCES